MDGGEERRREQTAVFLEPEVRALVREQARREDRSLSNYLARLISDRARAVEAERGAAA
jgi:hypothetical protein